MSDIMQLVPSSAADSDVKYDLAYDRMTALIETASRVDEAKDIRDKAEALRVYARQAGESLQNQNKVAAIKLRAERRIGELLGELERGQGQGNQYTASFHDGTKHMRPRARG